MTLWECLSPEVLTRIQLVAARYARRFRPLVAADDLSQEAVLRVLSAEEKKPHDFVSADHCVRWVAAIVRNVALESVRSRRKESQLHSDDVSASALHSSPAVQRAVSDISLEDIEEALSRLPERDRDLIERRLQGMTHSSIADQMNMTEKNARKRYSRAMDHMATILRRKTRLARSRNQDEFRRNVSSPPSNHLS